MLQRASTLARSILQASSRIGATGLAVRLPAAQASSMATASADALTDLLGDRVQTHDTTVSTSEVASDYVGLYFSASWCGPCRRWTPKLIDFYNKFSKLRPGQLEIVLVSSDRTEKDAKKYHSDMPWKMLPYEERDRRTQLASMYKVASIPNLVIVERATGKAVTTAGRDAIDADPDGKQFPWIPPTVSELAQGPVTTAAGEQSDFASVSRGKVTGIYFSAHWCPPCRKFTPHLVEFYKQLRGTDREFEVVFASRDNDVGQFDAYRAEMPWPSYALDRPENAKLAALCGVSTIPCLVLLDARGEVITTKAADLLRGDPTGADWPYLPKAVEKLTPLAAPIMNTATCCIAFVDGGAGGGVATGEAALKDAAEAEFAKAESQRQTHFYVARSDDEFVQRVMQVLGVDASSLPQLVITALPKFAAKPLPDQSLAVTTFLQDMRAGNVDVNTLE